MQLTQMPFNTHTECQHSAYLQNYSTESLLSQLCCTVCNKLKAYKVYLHQLHSSVCWFDFLLFFFFFCNTLGFVKSSCHLVTIYLMNHKFLTFRAEFGLLFGIASIGSMNVIGLPICRLAQILYVSI